jgi:predicted NBD/HSP70 family sugar kinase
MKRWGIDLGGTKIECAVLDDANNNAVLIRKRVPTEAEQGYKHIVAQIKKLVNLVAEELGEYPTTIGFATPGKLEPDTQVMKNCNTVCMNDQPMKRDIEEALGISIKIANDANCFAYAEALMGAGKDYPDAEVVFGVILGTGVGGGIVVNKKIINGTHGIGGEWGHNILIEDGEPCYCGKAGCVEKVISGPNLEKYYQKLSGTKKSLKDIANSTEIDEFAKATIEHLVENYGKALSVITNILDPDLIIIGGGVGNIDVLYTEGYERLKKYIFNSRKVTTTIIKPTLGDSAGVFGAALL